MPIDYETLIHEPARRICSEKSMTIEVTQEDREAADDVCTTLRQQVNDEKWFKVARILARHRQAAYEKGGRDEVERLTGLGGGS